MFVKIKSIFSPLSFRGVTPESRSVMSRAARAILSRHPGWSEGEPGPQQKSIKKTRRGAFIT